MNQMMKITQLPLQSLSTLDGEWMERIRDLGVEEVRTLLAIVEVPWVMVNLDEPVIWITGQDRFRHWKEELRDHLASGNASLDDFPDGYCYFASEWRSESGASAIVFEKHH